MRIGAVNWHMFRRQKRDSHQIARPQRLQELSETVHPPTSCTDFPVAVAGSYALTCVFEASGMKHAGLQLKYCGIGVLIPGPFKEL